MDTHDLALQGMGKLDELSALGELAKNLSDRVKALETDNIKWNEWEPKWVQMQEDLDALRDSFGSLGDSKGGDLDAAQIMLKIGALGE